MQPMRDENRGHGDHLATAGPPVDVHGRAVTTNPRAAARYRQAQRAADSRLATTALRLAVHADPAFGLAVADLGAMTGTASQGPSHQPMNWERHHIEVVTAAAGHSASESVLAARPVRPPQRHDSPASAAERTLPSKSQHVTGAGTTRRSLRRLA
jgi:hypothetical protein